MRSSIWLIVLGLFGCADPSLDGTYKGEDSGGNPDFPAKWTLVIATVETSSTDAVVEGTYQIKGIGLDTSGTISGSFVDPNLTLSLSPGTFEHCAYDLIATWNEDEIQGTYATKQCFVIMNGSVTLTKD